MTSTTQAVAAPRRSARRIPRFLTTPSGAIGAALIGIVVLLAIFGPLFAPHSIDTPVGTPGAPPGGSSLLGTDALGRDVLSRVLSGGKTVVGLGVLTTLMIYLIGVAVGLIAGYSQNLLDPILMRTVDFFLSFPAMLLLLLLVAGLGSGTAVTLLGVVLVLFPGVARIVRASTMEVSVRGYVEAAVARGEKTRSILWREILPNIISPIMADLGLRFASAIIFIASLNYLGLGLRPPSPDWGLMISENQQVIGTNLWSVLGPVIPIAVLTIGVNLLADAYARTRGRARA